jgi:hypothetical protein
VYDNTCAMINLPGGQTINKYPYPTSNDQVAAIVGGDVRVVFDVMSAQPAATHVRHGTNVAVDGAVWPARVYGRVLLQRLVSSSWHTVNSGGVRESGRYTVIATPPTAGNHQYRVVRPSDYCTNGVCRYIGAVSATFTITAT